MRSSKTLRILMLASFLVLAACAQENSDELTPEQKERIENMREARRQQQAEREREGQEIEDGKYLPESPEKQEPEKKEDDRREREDDSRVVEQPRREEQPEVKLPETAPIPEARPDREEKRVEVQPTPRVTPTPTPKPEFKPKEEPRIEVPPKKATPAPEQKKTTSGKRTYAPESGKCSYVSGLTTQAPRGRVVMTFDDGPSEKLTPGVLEVLKKYRVKATFFMLGSDAAKNPRIAKSVRDAGHLVGSHSWDHPNFHKLSESAQKAQIQKAENVLESLFPSTQKYFRYPYGNSTCSGNAYLHRQGYAIVGWNVDSCDWAFAENGRVSANDAKICGVSEANRSNFVGHVVSQVKAHHGGIILMHDVQAKTIRQLETLLSELLRQGYEFTNLDDPEFQGLLR